LVTRVAANKAAMKAMIVNVLVIFVYILATSFILSLSFIDYYTILTTLFIIFWCSLNLFFSSVRTVGKSAQFGLHTDYRMLWKALLLFCPITCCHYGYAGVFLIHDARHYLNMLLLFIFINSFRAITTCFAGCIGFFNTI
jgi:hypothetical protein